MSNTRRAVQSVANGSRAQQSREGGLGGAERMDFELYCSFEYFSILIKASQHILVNYVFSWSSYSLFWITLDYLQLHNCYHYYIIQ